MKNKKGEKEKPDGKEEKDVILACPVPFADAAARSGAACGDGARAIDHAAHRAFDGAVRTPLRMSPAACAGATGTLLL